MKTSNLNYIFKIVLLLFFIILVYFIYKFFVSNKPIEQFQSVSTTKDKILKCIAPKLLNVNYNDDEDLKAECTYNLKDFTRKNEYISLIENKQPFNQDDDDDCVCEVKQSANYVWFLNEKRNQIKKVKRDNLLKKNDDYINIFKNEGTENKFITAWGVSQDENYECCIVFVRDIDNLVTPPTESNNYFIIIKADIDTPIELYDPKLNPPKDNLYPDDIYTTKNKNIEELDIYGDIYIKLNKITDDVDISFNIICLNYYDTKHKFGIANNVKPLVGRLSFVRKKNLPATYSNFIPKDKNLDNDFYDPNLIEPSIDFNKSYLTDRTVEIIKEFRYDPPQTDTRKENFILQINEYINKLNLVTEGQKINLLLTKFCFDQIFDFTVNDDLILSCYKIVYNIDSNSKLECEITEIKYKINYDQINNPTSTTDVFGGISGSGSVLSSQAISNTDLSTNIILPNDKYLFALKRGVDINSIDQQFKDVRSVGHTKYNKDTEETEKKWLQTYYNFKYISIGADNIQGVLEFNKVKFDAEKSPIIQSIIKDEYQKNIYFTLYQHIIETGSKDILYGRTPLKDIVTMTAICYPALKFNYDSVKMNDELNKILVNINPNDVGTTVGGNNSCYKGTGFNVKFKEKIVNIKVPQLNKSIYEFFKSKQTEEGDEESDDKFKNPSEWILLYYWIRVSGLYDLERQDKDLNTLTDNIDNSILFQFNKDKWTDKHKDILIKGIENNEIYQKKSQIDIFPNISLFSTPTAKENETYIHLKYKIIKGSGNDTIGIKFSEELNKEEYNFLKLVPDNQRNENITLEVEDNEKKIDGVVYNYYKLEQTSKLEVEKGTPAFKLLHTWKREKVDNFKQFKELVLTNEKRLNEIDPRDRIRGIYELNEIYIDDYYIDFLKSNSTNLGKKDSIIEQKQKIVDTYCFDFDKNGKKINRIGYPFIVFYQDISYKGTPCREKTEDTQRIFLCNRVHPGHIKCELDTTNNIKGRYPLIKQEFLSFSGYGNIIQFYEKKFGGITGIGTSIPCEDTTVEIPGSCSTSNKNKKCRGKKLGMTTLDGMAKCEIENPNVKRIETNPIEVLVPGMVNSHICDIFILKGDKKIYFTLGKLFGNVDEELGLVKKYNTIKNQEGKYLFYNNDTQTIEYHIEPEKQTPNGKEVDDGFKFVKEFDSDNYGNYFLIYPKNNKGKYLTSKIDLYHHTLGGGQEKLNFELKGKNTGDRDHLNDEDYYSQKFIVNDSLFYADLPNKNEINSEMQKKIETNRKYRYEEARQFPELAVGDKSYKPVISDKEKQDILKKLLHDIKRYQRAKNERDSVTIENLGTNLPEAIKNNEKLIPSRTPVIQKQLHHLQHMISLNDKFEEPPSIYSKFEYPKMDEKDKNLANKISNNNKDMFTEALIIETGNALQQIKDFVPKNNVIQRRPSQCKNLNEGFSNLDEGFNNMYRPENTFSNHMVDKYNEFVVKKTQSADKLVDKIKGDLFDRMKITSEKISSIQMNGKKEQIKLSEEVANSLKLEDSIHDIKENEQGFRMDRMRDKIKEIKKLKCQLGDVSYKKKVKDHPKYNSIMSREDGSFMNIYKLDKKCDNIDSENLNKNMIFINGGCLSYDEEKMRLNIEHCHVTDKNQQFNIHKINDLNAMNNLKIFNDGKDLDRPHYMITKNPPKPVLDKSGGSSESIYSNDECAYNYAKFNEYNSPAETDGITCDREAQRKLCLHKEDGEISMRKCNNISNQQWDYSDITSHCN